MELIETQKHMRTYNVTLTDDQLELIATVCHEYKDVYRGDRYQILPVMALEAELCKQTDEAYCPDTTYDINA